VEAAKIELLQEHGDIAASSVMAEVIVPSVRVVPKSRCDVGKTLMATSAELGEEDGVYVEKDDRNVKEDDVTRVDGAVVEEMFVWEVLDGIVVLKIVSTTASTIVVVPCVEVANVVKVEIGKTHSIVPVCCSTPVKPSTSDNPPSIDALKQLWAPFPAHSLK
jgi:hypothetical protein